MAQSDPAQPQLRPLVALLVAHAISFLGNILAALAIPWFVLSITGSATSTAITVAVGTIPTIISGIFGGAIVDRLGYRRASILSDIASGVSTLGIPLLHLTIGIEFWQLLILVFLGALLDSPGNAARRSLFPDLVHLSGMDLERANAIYAFTGRLASLIGAPLAGILIATMGASNLLFFNAATFVVSALIFLVLIPSTERPGQEVDSTGWHRYIGEVREGFAFIRTDRLLLSLFFSSSIGSLLAEPLYAVILPVYVNEQYGSAEYLGFIFAGLAVGSLVGNVIYATMNRRLPRTWLLLGGFAVRAIAFTVLIVVPPWWVIAAAIFLGAVALEPVNPLWMTIMHERVPAGMRGRVFGVATAIGAATFPIGVIVYGSLLDGIGLEATLVIFVLLNLLVPAQMILNPALRDLQPPAKAETGTPVRSTTQTG
jgi:MFS family permease